MNKKQFKILCLGSYIGSLVLGPILGVTCSFMSPENVVSNNIWYICGNVLFIFWLLEIFLGVIGLIVFTTYVAYKDAE